MADYDDGGGSRAYNFSSSVLSDIKRSELKRDGVARHTGRDDRATVELVLDPRTRMVLYKLVNRGIIDELHGCISTGKEVRADGRVRGCRAPLQRQPLISCRSARRAPHVRLRPTCTTPRPPPTATLP